jgi:hypothetical protein
MSREKTICKGCGILISKQSISKHKRKNRCKEQHIRKKDKVTFGHKKTGK